MTIDPDQLRAWEALLADIDPDGMYGGIAGLWRLPADHPYQKAFRTHDHRYVLARLGLIQDSTSKATDLITLNDMLCIARELGSKKLEFQARFVFYPAMRLWGMVRWPAKK